MEEKALPRKLEYEKVYIYLVKINRRNHGIWQVLRKSDLRGRSIN